jgi:hypothetical protein
MQEWEYMSISVYSGAVVAGISDSAYGDIDDDLLDTLQRVGMGGWELVGIDSYSEGKALYVFKRPKQY